MFKDDGWLDFSQPAAALERRVRAMWPWPRAWTTTPYGERIQVHAAAVSETSEPSPGAVIHNSGRVLVATGEGSLLLTRVQLPGGRPIEGHAVASALSLEAGTILGQAGKPEDVKPLVIPVG
jgi:methionyl-tRNA formyltransferase